MIDLNAWHYALHQVTGAMTLRWCRATPEDLRQWSRELQAVAEAMEAACRTAPPTAQAMADSVPDWITQSVCDNSYTNP
jgi:hypothetical protein